MERDEAVSLAVEIWRAVAPACERCTIAGSLRRQQGSVKDIEIVALPRFTIEEDLFGMEMATERYCELEAILDRLQTSGRLALDPGLRRRGQWYRRFVVDGRLPLDLFLTRPENFGNILAIRTGDADFSRILVTPRRRGGLMPDHLAQEDGFLWRRMGSVRAQRMVKLCCPTERAFFEHLRLPWIAPFERTEGAALRLRDVAGAGWPPRARVGREAM